MGRETFHVFDPATTEPSPAKRPSKSPALYYAATTLSPPLPSLPRWFSLSTNSLPWMTLLSARQLHKAPRGRRRTSLQQHFESPHSANQTRRPTIYGRAPSSGRSHNRDDPPWFFLIYLKITAARFHTVNRSHFPRLGLASQFTKTASTSGLASAGLTWASDFFRFSPSPVSRSPPNPGRSTKYRPLTSNSHSHRARLRRSGAPPPSVRSEARNSPAG